MEWIVWVIFFVSIVVYLLGKACECDLVREEGVLKEPEVTLIRPTKQESVCISHWMWKEPEVVSSKVVSSYKKRRLPPNGLEGYEKEIEQRLIEWYSQKNIGELLWAAQSTVSTFIKKKGITIDKKLDHSEHQKIAKEAGYM